jgi:serine/threonine protein kinase/WD40 repeat protein
MSVVYLARQRRPARMVALKLILQGVHASPERRARFLAEANAIGRLQHPHVVQIYEVGEWASQLFLALEWVNGGSLASRLTAEPQHPMATAALIEKVARGIHYAHECGIVHRDLKPSNILLQSPVTQPQVEELANNPSTESARVPDAKTAATADAHVSLLHVVPKVADFGLAKQEDVNVRRRYQALLVQFVTASRVDPQPAHLTATSMMLGTPAYMAPEQAAGDNRLVGPAADIHALGAVLYEMLTGRPPYQGTSVLETLDQLRSWEPPTPRQRTQVHADLSNICMKCLRKEPGQRYASALELAEDLGRFQAGLPTIARPVSTLAWVWRWARRNRGWAATLAGTAALLLVIAVTSVVASFWLAEARDEARSAEKHEAEQRAVAEANLLRAKAAERGQREKLFEALLAQARAITRSRRSGQRFDSLKALAEAIRLARELQLPPERFLDLRNTAIAALAVTDLQQGHSWDGYLVPSTQVDFDEELRVYARLDLDNQWDIRRVADDRLLYRLPDTPKARGQAPYFSRDGRHLATVHVDGSLHFWNLKDDGPRLLFKEQNVEWVCFHPRKAEAVVVHKDGVLNHYDLHAGKLLNELKVGAATREAVVAIHPNEPLLAVASYFTQGVQIRDLNTGEVLRCLDWDGAGYDVAWHPQGHTLAVSDGKDTYFYDRATFNRFRTLPGSGGGTRIAFNPAGDRLASYNWAGELRLLDANTGQLLFQPPRVAVRMPFGRPRFSKDGRQLAGTVQGKHLQIWTIGDGSVSRILLDKDSSWASIGPDSRLLAILRSDGMHLLDLTTGSDLGRLPGRLGVPFFQRTDPPSLVTTSESGLLRWSVRQERDSAGTVRVGPPLSLARVNSHQLDGNSDGQVLVASAGTRYGLAPYAGGWVFRADRPGSPLCVEKGRDVLRIVVSPNGRLVATNTTLTDGTTWSIKVWDARDGSLVKELETREGVYPCFSPDGRWLAVGGEAGCLFAVETWEPGLRFRGHPQFTPDGRVLAVHSGDGVIRLIDIARDLELARLEDPQQKVADLHLLSPDGTQLVVISFPGDSGLRTWNLRQLRRQLKELGLDWDAPEYPPEPPAMPLRLVVETD